MPVAATRRSTSPARTSGSGASSKTSCSGPPRAWTLIAFTYLSALAFSRGFDLAASPGLHRGEDGEATDGLDLHVSKGPAKDLLDPSLRVVEVVEHAAPVEDGQEPAPHAGVIGGPAEDRRAEERRVGREDGG